MSYATTNTCRYLYAKVNRVLNLLRTEGVARPVTAAVGYAVRRLSLPTRDSHGRATTRLFGKRVHAHAGATRLYSSSIMGFC